MTEELLTISEVARRLRVDTSTVRRWIRHGLLEAVTLPHTGNHLIHRVRASTLAKMLHSEEEQKEK